MVKWGFPRKTFQFTRIDLMSAMGPPKSKVKTKPNFGAISPLQLQCKTKNRYWIFVYGSLNFCGGSTQHFAALVQKELVN